MSELVGLGMVLVVFVEVLVEVELLVVVVPPPPPVVEVPPLVVFDAGLVVDVVSGSWLADVNDYVRVALLSHQFDA